jgi:Zn finger protein HypA/HybF involved in hydrogenase expression
MEKRSFLMAGALILVFAAFALTTDTMAQEAAKQAETDEVTQKCLACHGPYDKLAQATADYTAPSGETVTPHQYVPHEEKKDIPKCTECHKPHEIPLQDKSTVVKPGNIDFCYAYCHHAQNLQPCSNCH